MSPVHRTLRVLHLASFAGNIGDVANHAGARWLFRDQLGVDLEVEELEIREFYWKQRQFDANFVDYANSFDLLLIGGGNYFEVWVEKSATGTSIDIAPDVLAALSVPTLFYALGVDTGQGYTETTVSRFRAFLATLLERDNMFVCVRNDGSSRALTELVSSQVADIVPMMPDGGFFAGRALGLAQARMDGRRTIGMNIAGDMADQRYGEGEGYKTFLGQLSMLSQQLIDLSDDVELMLVPHIWRDVQLLSDLLGQIPDPYIRRRMIIGPLEPRAPGLRPFLADYAKCSAVLGMRFHANVCPVGMGVPTVGLVSYPQVRLLYEEMQAPQRLVHVNSPSFVADTVAKTRAILDHPETAAAESRSIMAGIDLQAATALQQIGAWLNSVSSN